MRLPPLLAPRILRASKSIPHRRYSADPMPTAPSSPIYFANIPISHQVFYTSTTGLSHALINLRPLLPGHTLIIPHRTSAVHLADLSETERNDLFATVVRVQRTLKRVYSGSAAQQQQQQRATDAVAEDGLDAGKGWRRARRPAGEVTAFNVATQDGAAAGQTVPHVHVHIIPRREGDMEAYGGGDVLYEWLEGEEGNVGGQLEEASKEEAGRDLNGGGESNEGGGREEGGLAGEKRRGFAPDVERRDRSMAEMRAEAEWLSREMAKDEDVGNE